MNVLDLCVIAWWDDFPSEMCPTNFVCSHKTLRPLVVLFTTKEYDVLTYVHVPACDGSVYL